MIELVICKREGLFAAYELNGHSEYDEYGKDIVCAAVSILAQTTANGITEVLGAEAKIEHAEAGYLKLTVTDRNEDTIDKASLLIKTMAHGMAGIAEQYPEYVKLTIEEVKSHEI